ncbi:helical backbone metal receptor [bacterium]|nr:helical backbone metal receptor [bacterium]
MKIQRPLLSFILAASFLSAPLGSATEVVDVTGARVKIPDQPKRIVTLIPSLGELAADFFQQDLDKIVGVSEATDYPPALSKTRSVGPYPHISLEKVLELKPDLVLGSKDGNSKQQLERLRELGIPVVIVSTSNFEEVYKSIELVGAALGFEKDGKKMAEQLKRGVDHVCAKAKGQARVKTFVQLGEQPLITIGKSTFLQEALQCVGGDNIYADLSLPYPRPTIEDMVHRNPDIVLVMTFGGDRRYFNRMAAKWKDFPQMKAVQTKRVHVVSGDTILRPTLRMLEGMSLLERAVHPKVKK